MLAAIIFSIVGLSFNVVGPAQYDLITPTPPLANLVSADSCLCGLDCLCGRTATPAPVQAVSCENGTCSINRANVAPPSTVGIPTYQTETRYIARQYQSAPRHGLFGRVKGGGACRGGQCGR